MAQVKACTVAIGLVPIGGFKPVAVLGSGFFVDAQGFVMTAAHVFKSCKYAYQEFIKRKIRTTVAAFQLNPNT
jgi:hypothetical protein